MEKNKKQFSVSMDRERLRKLKYIAKKEYRSVSGLLSVLARKYITEFEEQHGTIPNEEQTNLL